MADQLLCLVARSLLDLPRLPSESSNWCARIPTGLADEVQRLCDRLGVSQQEFTRLALERAVRDACKLLSIHEADES